MENLQYSNNRDGIDWQKASAIILAIQAEGNVVVDGQTGRSNRVDKLAIFGQAGVPESQDVVWLPSDSRFKFMAGFSINPILMVDGVPTLTQKPVGGTLIYRGECLETTCINYNANNQGNDVKRFLHILDLND